MKRNDKYHFLLQVPEFSDCRFSLKPTETFEGTLTKLHELYHKYLIYHYNGQLLRPEDTPLSIKASYSPLGSILNGANVITGQFIDPHYRVLKLMKRGIEGIIVKVDVSTTLQELRSVIDENGLVQIEKLNYEGGKTYHDENLAIGGIGVSNDDVLIFHYGVQVISAVEFIESETNAKQKVAERKCHEYELSILGYEKPINCRAKRHPKKRRIPAPVPHQTLSPPKTPASKSPPCQTTRVNTKITDTSVKVAPPHYSTNSNEYQCCHELSSGKLCLKTFTRPYDLTRHQNHTHLRTTKLFCALCQEQDIYKAFGRLDSLRRHYRAKHSVKKEELGDLIEISGIEA